MAVFSKNKLSSSSNGRGILVSATSTPGTLIHTSASASGSYDEVWIYAANTSVSDVKLTLEYGGTSTQDLIEITLQAESGLTLICPGLFLDGGNEIKAFASSTNVVSVHGYVNTVS